MWAFAAAVGAALAFPVVVVAVYRNRELARHRRAGKRRTDKIRL